MPSPESPKRFAPQRASLRPAALPGPRVIAGSLLVVVAAASTFAAVTGTIEADAQAVVVASRDISPGTRLQRQDLRVVKMSAPPKPGSVAGSPAQLEGLTALGPIGEGELVQANNLLRKDSTEDQPEISFAIPAARAVGGDLRPGERIEVLATDKGDAKAGARVAAVASVVEVQSGSQGVQPLQNQGVGPVWRVQHQQCV